MSILIAGGDRTIPAWLTHCTEGEVIHWSGRGAFRQPIPESVEVVVLLTRYLNHALADRLKREAGKKGLRLVYARSMSGLREKIGEGRV